MVVDVRVYLPVGLVLVDRGIAHSAAHSILRDITLLLGKPPLHLHTAFSLCLGSEIPLGELLPPTNGEPDVTLEELDREAWERERGVEANRSQSSDRVFGHFYHSLRYLVEGGRSIKVYRERPLPEDLVRRCLIGLPLAILLRQRGVLTLHAGAVAKAGAAVAFVGPSGAGKSTLSELFHQHGYEVLTDDLLAVRFDEGGPVVVPGAPQIRLRAGSGATLVPEYETLPAVFSGSDQRLRVVSNNQCPVPLTRLYLLDADDAPETSIEPVASTDAVMALIPHTWAHNLFSEPPYAERHLQQLGALVRQGCVARFRRVRSLDVLGTYVEHVEADLARLPRE